MELLRKSANGLIGSWQSYDWRENLLAPGLCILQARTESGTTASGAGSRRETAFQRCLSETAELHALEFIRRTRPGDEPFAPTRDGLAADASPLVACTRALLEACERRGVSEWWMGRLPARPICSGWLAAQGLVGWLSALRKDAALKRNTGLWFCEASGGPAIVIAQSSGSGGQHRMLGFGCAAKPVDAARKALRELLMMELALMEYVFAPECLSAGARASMQRQIGSYAQRCPALLPDDRAIEPLVRASGPIIDPGGLEPRGDISDWFEAALELTFVTPPDGPIAVARCRPESPIPYFPGHLGTPFIHASETTTGGEHERP